MSASPESPSCLPSVTLVGAGPGDPDLLTVKAVKALRRATVVLVDDLVGDGVLRYVRRSARIVHVGKRGGCRSTPQAFIDRLMITEARRGEQVVRLKGGDPFIFGRGGEEIERLREAGIGVEVVNGITAGLAAATGLGAPLTHRDHAHGVIFVTGHARAEDAAPDWPQLAATAAQGFTLVIYMGVSQAATIEAGLLSGLAPSTPLAIVQHASQPRQRHALTTLVQLRTTLAREQLGSPAIIVVGDVLRGLLALAEPRRTAA